MYCPNYLEFYQTDLIPIGPRDRKNLLKNGFPVNAESSHWLIALDGRPLTNNPFYYSWNIVVYQASADGYFLMKKQPYYLSEPFIHFDETCAAAKVIAEICRNDRFLINTSENETAFA